MTQAIQCFAFGPGKTRWARIWGRGNDPLPVYGKEVLPAFFERQMVIARGDLKEGQLLRWLFTGPRATLTVDIHPRELVVYRSHTDSMGAFPESDETAHSPWIGPRHPLVRKHFRRVDLPDMPSEIRVVVDRSLKARIFWGKELSLSLPMGEDLLRWQIQVIGEPVIEGRIQQPSCLPVTVEMNPQKRFQEIIGFGGIGSPMT